MFLAFNVALWNLGALAARPRDDSSPRSNLDANVSLETSHGTDLVTALKGTDFQSARQLAHAFASSALVGTGLIQTSSKYAIGQAAKSLQQYVTERMATKTENTTKTESHSRLADHANKTKSDEKGSKPGRWTQEEILSFSLMDAVSKSLLTVIIAFVLSKQVGKGLVRVGEGDTLQPSQQFSSGLCDCGSDLYTCMLSCCCPSAQWALNVGMVPIGAFWAAFFLRLTFTLTLETFQTVLGLMSFASIDFSTSPQVFVKGTYPMYTYVQTLIDSSAIAIAVLGMLARQDLRSKFGMETGGITMFHDCCSHFFCSCCAIAQEARHIHAAAALAGEPVLVQAHGTAHSNAAAPDASID